MATKNITLAMDEGRQDKARVLATVGSVNSQPGSSICRSRS
jgi:hypothetical protein